MVDKVKFLRDFNIIFNKSVKNEEDISWEQIFADFHEVLLIDFFDEFIVDPCIAHVGEYTICTSYVEFVLIWNAVSECDNLGYYFISEFATYLNWVTLSGTKSITIENVDSFSRYVYWSIFLDTHKISDEFAFSHVADIDPEMILEKGRGYLSSKCLNFLETYAYKELLLDKNKNNPSQTDK